MPLYRQPHAIQLDMSNGGYASYNAAASPLPPLSEGGGGSARSSTSTGAIKGLASYSSASSAVHGGGNAIDVEAEGWQRDLGPCENPP